MKKRFLSAVLACLLLCALVACGGKTETPAGEGLSWQEQYDLGVRYLSEGNYEEAIIAFTAAIEIDPKRPEAYISLADVHTARGDTMAAMDVLNQALGAVGENDALSAALEKLRGGPRTRRTDFEDGHYLIIEYDDHGNQVRTTQYNADGTLMVETEYDTDGNEVRMTLYYDNGDVDVSLFEYYADGKWRAVRIFRYGPDGAEYDHQLQEFDADGNMVRVTWYNTDGTVSRVEEYDADGNLVRRTQYNDDGTVWKVDEYN